METRDQVPVFCWLSMMFMQSCQRQIEVKSKTTITELYTDFCRGNGIDLDVWSYDLLNQGLVMSSLYGLLVYPHEMWEKDKTAGTGFKFSSRDAFEFSDLVSHPMSIWNDERYRDLTHFDFLRLLRNAVSHANIKVGVDTQAWIFWNIDLKNRKNFEVKVSNQELGFFITEVGKYFINEVRVEGQKLDSIIPFLGSIS